ncbi:MAG: hypothetical protein GXP16_16575 [Gammaproteobacteria bacterium]|nr:hypothetical protein [Gammaproteobacteria bacterium]
MSDSDNTIIAPQSVPLSHLHAQQHTHKKNFDRRYVAAFAAVSTVIAVAFIWAPTTSKTIPQATLPSIVLAKPGSAESSASVDLPTDGNSNISNDNRLAPFAATQRKRARELAQASLAGFVEQQIRLEDSMAVQQWGEQTLQSAMDLAKTGDQAFLVEDFPVALAAYDEAQQQLTLLIQRGNELFEEHLDAANLSINELDVPAAKESIQQALTIKPNHTAAGQVQFRIDNLPKVISLLRTAKNHELGGRFEQALEVYQSVRQLDPLTSGLTKQEEIARQGQTGNDLNNYISRGFAALKQGTFESARTAFKAALAIDPNNEIALGGLQQVAKRNDLSIIRGYQQTAAAALNAEEWQKSINAYQAVLKLDGNIHFALNGLQIAKSHSRHDLLLEKISTEPKKLSSEKLFLEATSILATAKQLTHRGERLSGLIEEVDRLLVLYRDPVDVVLLSDNATEVIVSNVGRLGRFERKNLSLRPGQYTIRGSQNGCRDIYLSIEVLPGIAPLDLSCPQELEN